MNISVVGLGKLGLCTAACFASEGHKVVGVEKNLHFVEQLQARRCPIDETGLEELLKKSWDNLIVTTGMAEAIMASEVTLIIVPTPSKSDGKFTNEYVETVLRAIGPALSQKDQFHVVDVVSTVMPGSCERSFKPLLEELSGKVCGEDFGLVYNPEFIALGSVIRDFSRPDMVLIGASDDRSAKMVEQIYLSSCENEPHIATMSLLNAEITKLSLNCFVTTKISFANELASICEKVPGADVDTITAAIGNDSRIGNKYLNGGLGFGGPCFPRDNLAFQAFAKGRGAEVKLGPQVLSVNNTVVDRLLNIICEKTSTNERIALFGLSYKPQTHIVEESQSIMLAQKLVEAGYKVAVHDPKSLNRARDVLGETVVYHDDPYTCAENAAAVALLTDWPIYRQLNWMRVSKLAKRGALILDSWRVLKESDLDGFYYVPLGVGRQS